MKKRKKLLISIFSIFAFILSIFSISNVFAYSYDTSTQILSNNSITDFYNYSTLIQDDADNPYSHIEYDNINTVNIYFVDTDGDDEYIFSDSRLSNYNDTHNYLISFEFNKRVDFEIGGTSYYNIYSVIFNYDEYFDDNYFYHGLYFYIYNVNQGDVIHLKINLFLKNSLGYLDIDNYSNSDYFSSFYSSNRYDEIVNNPTNYSNGYNSGYNDGYGSGYSSGYDIGYNDGGSYYHTLYDNLLIQYNDLQTLYDDYVSGKVSFNTLVWNIATIPFESFKQIWNVDLLGLNIGNFVTALMFVGVVVYIWKKFL